jgi:FtsZ-binding cell division protein ZapB
MTQSKKDSYVKRLHSVDQYLKDAYVLTKKALDDSVQNIHDSYKLYCLDNDIKNVSMKIDFNKKMTELGFSYYSSSHKGKTSNKYKISVDQFTKLAETLHWIHDLDEYKTTKKDIITYKVDDEYKEAYDKSQIKLKTAVDEIKELKKQIEEIKLKTNNLKTNVITRINKQICSLMDSDTDSDDDDEEDDEEDEEDDEEDEEDEEDDILSDDEDLGDLSNEYDEMVELLNSAIAFEEE